ncbi:phosphoglycerate mutase-like protein [Cylindrobasidium torrendii FP15055 ss-10]|uniref:Phosphoglycerate mutase-like protein n=1 Tax=Cylindrobasidium torrendii FP15055 ss-10 TaxID=1314674 RepID=A0A0D7BI35_9AGAR|nr:phosphoglycerate mutase-like protein [Cylindrobasidium torrendii FP15055 ss-10]
MAPRMTTLAGAALLAGLVSAESKAFFSLDQYTFEPLQHSSGIAPYFDPMDPALDPAAPQGCNVTRAAYLVRHAAIYANDFDYESYIEPFTDKLANNSDIDWSKSQDLAFLADWKTPIEDSDLEELTKIGREEAEALGADILQRYPSFAPPKKVWSSTADRTVESAQSLMKGLNTTNSTTTLTTIIEGKESGADSLTPYKACPAYSSSKGSEQSSEFRKKYTAPIVARFRAEVPSFNWTDSDVYGMQQLCGYEAVIRGSSPFCSANLFTPNEWLAFEYANDLMYFHNTGYGSESVSGAIGFPWANASAALLLADTDAENVQDLYVSFTHRELPPTVLVALGLFNNTAFSGSNDQNATMPTDTVNHRRAWKSSHMLTFLTNIAIEKMDCDSYGFDKGEYFRVLVNSSPQPLQGCAGGPGESCSRDGFTEFIQARAEMFGDFSSACEVDYDNSTNVLDFYSL